MKRIVFSDVDGTLLNSEYKITPLTQQAIRRLEEKGVPFVIVSGRSPSGIYHIQEEYGFKSPIISYSGALILDADGNVRYSKGIAKSRAKKILEFIENQNFDVTWNIYAVDDWIVKDKSDPRVVQEEKNVKAAAAEGSLTSIPGDEIHKVLCIGEPEEILRLENRLKQAFSGFYIVKSAPHLLEIMEAGVNKAAAVKTLCALWNIHPKNAVAFGDNYNDLEMLQTVGHGILMGNAPQDLKQVIPTHTLDNDSDGIYHALRKLNLI